MQPKTAKLENVDIPIVTCVLILLVTGLFTIYSATQNAPAMLGNVFSKQLSWMVVALLAVFAVNIFPIQLYRKYAYLAYAAIVLLLLLVLVIGKGSGATRWFYFGPIRVQPSEFAKLVALLALARFLSDDRFDALNTVKGRVIAFSIVLLPMGLIVKQPDLGTSLVFPVLILPVLFWAGLHWSTTILFFIPVVAALSSFNLITFFIAMGCLTFIMVFSRKPLSVIIPNFIINILAGLLTPYIWLNKLHTYQQNRILTFLGLEQDPRGLGYQVLQSKVGIGSGGWLGKGWLEGTQTQLRFLPEQHTDFIFSVVGEEFGFLGVSVILLTFMVIIWRTLKIASECKNRFASLVATGSAVILLFHVIVNTGMTVGIMPVTGLPLPFLSYGGSALLSNMVMIGLILNIGRRRLHYG